jgi:endonuclease-3
VGRTYNLDKKESIQDILKLLEKEHPDAKIALHYSNPLELLVATILSAQCTDKTVNEVTNALFEKYRTAQDYARVNIKALEREIRSTGFYHNKAKNLKKTAQILMKTFNGQVPKTMDELLTLPGVARKTANIVLSNAYSVIEGIAVDTHVRRLARRLGLTENDNPNKIEQDLMKLVPREQWPKFTDLLIFHGRRSCTAKKPLCEKCVVNKLCPSARGNAYV